ncbi:MAG: hypothetical protein PHZ19_05310 [Candidatus Thermoplasmatota archaeon]|nr:hypothetical protein [Candidatus Thermoplasmatota archaeon]
MGEWRVKNIALCGILFIFITVSFAGCVSDSSSYKDDEFVEWADFTVSIVEQYARWESDYMDEGRWGKARHWAYANMDDFAARLFTMRTEYTDGLSSDGVCLFNAMERYLVNMSKVSLHHHHAAMWFENFGDDDKRGLDELDEAEGYEKRVTMHLSEVKVYIYQLSS